VLALLQELHLVALPLLPLLQLLALCWELLGLPAVLTLLQLRLVALRLLAQGQTVHAVAAVLTLLQLHLVFLQQLLPLGALLVVQDPRLPAELGLAPCLTA
jgi:hypothetical protein